MTVYGYRWRVLTRPRALQRAGGIVDPVWKGAKLVRLEYRGGAHCQKCGQRDPDFTLAGKRTRSRLDVAHLDGNTQNDADDNLKVLCHRGCHRAHDLPVCGPKARKTRCKNRAMAGVMVALAKDADRPLFQLSQGDSHV